MKLKRRKNLQEAINVQNTSLIGTSKGYDVFDILTFEAAEHFVIGDSNELASKFVKNEETFNNNIHDDKHLYFFVRENQNNVDGAVIIGHGSGNVVIKNIVDENITVTVGVNFLFEQIPDNTGEIIKTLPLYLIPGATFNHVNIDKGTIIEDELLKAVLPQLTPNEDIVIDCTELGIRRIDKNAFNYGLNVSSVILNDTIENVKVGTFNNVESIKVTCLEPQDSWDENWNEGKEAVTTWGYGLDPEQIELINTQRREEQEQRRQAEIEREADRLNADILWYSDDGDLESDRYVRNYWEELNDIILEFNNSSDEIKDRVSDRAKEVLNLIKQSLERLQNNKIQKYKEQLDSYIPLLPENNEVTFDNYDQTLDTIIHITSAISAIENDRFISEIRAERIPTTEIQNRIDNLKSQIDNLREEKEARDEQLRLEREARKLRYKVEGKNITITGTRLGVRELDIPEEIDGKPVTKIAAYAFYDNEDLRRVIVPKTVKLIEKGAFLGTHLDYRVQVSKDCVVGKYNNDASIYRRY